LINRISEMGYRFIYSPDIKIYRDRRKNILAFMRQFYRYGGGRMDQIFIEGCLKNAHFFTPILFLAYILSIAFLREALFLLPAFIYGILAVIDAAYLSFKNKENLIFILPFLYLAMHVSYAAGMAGKLLFRFARFNREMPFDNISIKYIKELGEAWHFFNEFNISETS
jgi:hypothetical protein